jgi:methylmalonyl-CoA mutase, N-terminal domain
VTISGYVVDPTYGPEKIDTADPNDPKQVHPRIGNPGQYPFTRGIHETMYRQRLWTMRQFAGFGSADDTNKRFKYLLQNAKHGKAQTGLSTAFDLPTLMGRDRTTRSRWVRSAVRRRDRHHRGHASALCRHSRR